MSDTATIKRDLMKRVKGEVLTGIFDRGRYATDASSYQMMPLAVVLAEHENDVVETVSYAGKQGVPTLAPWWRDIAVWSDSQSCNCAGLQQILESGY